MAAARLVATDAGVADCVTDADVRRHAEAAVAVELERAADVVAVGQREGLTAGRAIGEERAAAHHQHRAAVELVVHSVQHHNFAVAEQNVAVDRADQADVRTAVHFEDLGRVHAIVDRERHPVFHISWIGRRSGDVGGRVGKNRGGREQLTTLDRIGRNSCGARGIVDCQAGVGIEAVEQVADLRNADPRNAIPDRIERASTVRGCIERQGIELDPDVLHHRIAVGVQLIGDNAVVRAKNGTIAGRRTGGSFPQQRRLLRA